LVLAFGLVYVCWGTTYLALKKAVREEHLPPLMFGGIRVCIAGLLLLGWQATRRAAALRSQDWLPVLICAILLFVGGNGLINLAGQTLDSGVCAILAATTPLWIGLLAMLWPSGERLSALGWGGLVLGLAGVLLLCVPALENAATAGFDYGYLLVLASAGCWALGSLVGRHLRIQSPHLTSAAYQMIVGGGSLAVVGVLSGEVSRMPAEATPKMAAAFLWLLVVGSLLGFVAYNWLLAHVTAAQAGTYAYVNPAIAVLIGIADGEEPTGWLAIGIVVILMGVALVRSGGTAVATTDPAAAVEEEVPDAEPELCRKEEVL
jgi:drug/metabolite transporter (DMT)-like permease